jgi:hypothetical protein
MMDLRQSVLDDLTRRVTDTIASRSEYSIGDVHGRLIAFALSSVITKEEFDAYHDRLEASGIASIRIVLKR